MSLIPADVRIAVRALRRSPGFLLVAVLTLALGIGASSAIFSVVHGVLLREPPYPDADRLVHVFTTDETDDRKYTSPPNFAVLRERRDVFTDVAAFDYSTPTLVGLGEAAKLESAQVSAGFFEILGASPLLGRTFRGEENEPGRDDAVVLGHAL